MYRQPIAGFLLLFVTVAGALATHRDQGYSLDETGHLSQSTAPAKLDPEAAARARAEWEDILRSAEVRLMALERIQDQSAAVSEEGPRPAVRQAFERAGSEAEKGRQQSTERISAPVKAARKSLARAAASSRTQAAEPWTHDFYATR